MGEGAGHNQSLRNYQYEKGDNATLGNKVQTSIFRWGRTQTGEVRQQKHSVPHPHSRQMDSGQPWRAMWGGRSHRVGSVRAERRGLRDHRCKMSPPRLTPLHTTPKTCGLVASGVHCLPFHGAVATPGGVSDAAAACKPLPSLWHAASATGLGGSLLPDSPRPGRISRSVPSAPPVSLGHVSTYLTALQ